jgi:hypothetical protein
MHRAVVRARIMNIPCTWSAHEWALLLAIVTPYVAIAGMYFAMIRANRITTGEIKFILPPKIALKIVAIIMIVQTTLLLAIQKILEPSAVAALMGAVATATIGMRNADGDSDKK